MTTEVRNEDRVYRRFFYIVISILVLCACLYSYLKTEISTRFYLSEITTSQELCANSETALKYVKVLHYERKNRVAELYCIYENPDKNVYIKLNYRNDRWETYFTERLNKPNHMYWPIYI